MFDSTDIKGRKPLSFSFGKMQLIPGLEDVISNMQPGGEVTCSIPSKYAYGAKGICMEVSGLVKELHIGGSYHTILYVSILH